jgi:DsbC/DsbD-like thiol-disulfide interchange protein
MLVALDEYLDARPAAARGPAATPVANTPGESETVVTAHAALAPAAAVQPGRELEVSLTLAIKDGWHLYANPTGSEVLKPTTVTLAEDQGHELVLVDYPAGQAKVLASSGPDEVPVYEGKVKLTAHVRLAGDAKPGSASLDFKVRYQACNDRSCLAPTTLSVPLTLKIEAR